MDSIFEWSGVLVRVCQWFYSTPCVYSCTHRFYSDREVPVVLVVLYVTLLLSVAQKLEFTPRCLLDNARAYVYLRNGYIPPLFAALNFPATFLTFPNVPIL